MVFSSLSFIFFFLPILFFIYFIAKEKYRNYILLIFSLIFYSWGEPKYILLMIISIIMNYIFGILINNQKKNNKRKLFLVLAIIFHLGLLFYFKYTNFFVNNINNIFGLSINSISVLLPIGISFYTFQELSYLIDVYKKKIKVQKNIFYLGTYISFFPQLIAGPIVRYSDIEKQLKKRVCSFDKFCDGARRFIIGLGKKVLIANNVAIIVDGIFNNGGLSYLGALIIMIGMIAFTIQLYYDFSGYSDMAIGLAKMFGFDFLENFNYPYIATSVTDFWRRWHISLSSWFRDYIYIPLGGNRVNKIKFLRNVLIVWFLTGLWHGASWNYVLWGLYMALFLLIEKVFKNQLEKIPNIIRWFVTFIFINISMILFKFENLSDIGILLKNIFTFKGTDLLEFLWNNYNLINYFSFLIIGLIFMFPIINKFKKYNDNKVLFYIKDIVLIIIFLLSIGSLINNSYNPFIYFRF